MTNLLCKIFLPKGTDPNTESGRSKLGALSGGVGIATNFILAALKMIIGFLARSVAITADGFNNLSDAGSSLITLVSFRLASRPADREHPFGHARIEYVASMIVSFLILLVGGELFLDNAKTVLGLQTPETIDINAITVTALALSILLKLWLGFFYKKIAKLTDSSVIAASATDSFSDCISTFAVTVSSLVILVFDLGKAAIYVDAALGICVSVIILIAGIKIFKETLNTLIGEAPVKETVKSIEGIIAEYPEIHGIHDMMVHNYGPNHTIASLHAEVNGNEDIFMLHDVIDNAERMIHEKLGILCTIHMDPIATDDEKVCALKEFVGGVLKDIDPTLKFHDFRTVIGETHTNLIFDIVLPFESKYSPAEETEIIAKRIHELRPECFAVITVDRG